MSGIGAVAQTADVQRYLTAAGATTLTSRTTDHYYVIDGFIEGGMSVPHHGHDRAVLAFTYGGGCSMRLGSFEERLASPSILFMPSGEEHSVHYGCAGERVLSIEVHRSDAGLALPGQRLTLSSRDVLALAWHVVEEVRHSDRYADIAIEGLVSSVFARVARTSADGPRSAPPWLACALDFLRDVHDSADPRPVAIRELAAEVGVSRSQLTRVFERHLGCTPSEYQQNLRLSRARVRLETTDAPIGDIAFDAGFSDPSYFTRAFRRTFGIVPSELRKRT